jgi:UDP-N-acetylglucosamine--N-acetylmuramyl-(pentapeptide) pyrophosphoryl-undecaprenol N-acetylglucosamine transferase
MTDDELAAYSGTRAVLAASTGGHLEQLTMISRRLRLSPDSLWITFDHPQSRSLLADARVKYVPYISPRDYIGVVRAVPFVAPILRRENFDVALSTGAGVALSVLPVAGMFGCKPVYVESVSRFDGPSLTGRFLARIPGVSVFTQHPNWADNRWRLAESVLASFRPLTRRSGRPKRIFVTLGTIRPYRFDTLVDRLLSMFDRVGEVEVVWQLGSTDRDDLPGVVRATVTAEEFDRYVTESDVVISHAGVGSALKILALGRSPVLVTRRAARHEHVDDHQQQVASALAKLGLSVSVEAPDLSWEHLTEAAAIEIVRV